MVKLEGLCFFHSETGTEGGYWAFQDNRFITKNTRHFNCIKCYKYWDKELYPDGPPKELDQTKSVYITKIIPFNDLTSDKVVLNLLDLATPPECPYDEHDFQPVSEHNWSYDGLHILEDGDWLIIYSKTEPKSILWSGIIKLKQHELFSKTVFNMWIHTDQEGVDRATWALWFMETNPATLIPKQPIKS